MDEILNAITIGDVITALIWVGVALAGLKWVKPALKQIGDFLGDWQGQPARPGVDARPGVMEQLGTLKTDVNTLKTDVDLARVLARDAAESAADAAHHSKPDHGDSSYDKLMKKIDGINAAITASEADRKALHKHSDEQSEILRAVVDHLGLNPKEDTK